MTTDSLRQSLSLSSLHRRWRLIVIFYSLFWLAGIVLLRTGWDPAHAGHWAIAVLGVLGYQMWLLRRSLRRNHRQGESSLLPTLGWGNTLTLSRGLAYGLMAGFLFSPWPEGVWAWTPAVLYTVASISDYLDGYLARVTDHATVLGEVLDIEFDGLGIAVAVALAVQYGQLPLIYLPLAFGRTLFLLGLWWRRHRGAPVYGMTPSANRRLIAGLHMGFLTVVLWPILDPPVTYVAGFLFGVPAAASFLRDWFVVNGQIDPQSALYVRTRRLLGLWGGRWLPVLLRLVGGIGAGILMWRAWQAPLPWPGMGTSDVLMVGLLGLGGMMATLVVAGVLGRSLSLALIALACADVVVMGFDGTNGTVLVASIGLLLLGTGAFSLWQPEERAIRCRAGEERTQA